jgi:hypothetical protein
MNSFLKSDVKIREIDPILINEIELVAIRMRQTLVKVLGPEKGTVLYTLEWLLERVRWHLDSQQTTAKIYFAEENTRTVGHAIARIEKDEVNVPCGLFFN